MTDIEQKALVERLRAGWNGWITPISSDAADQIEADGQRIAELEKALRSIIDAFDEPHYSNLDMARYTMFDAIEDARAALGKRNDRY